jgi:Mg2+ and Co2+ transporter CorA
MTGITKETFKEADPETKMDILFDCQRETSDDIKQIMKLMQEHPLNCESRFKKLEKRKFKDTIVAGGMGFIGGFSAVIAKLKLWG